MRRAAFQLGPRPVKYPVLLNQSEVDSSQVPRRYQVGRRVRMVAARKGLAPGASGALSLLFVSVAQTVEAQVCSPTLFIEAASYPTGGNARAVAVGDFNGDNKPDVAAANIGIRSIAILLNDGNGGLGAPILTP